MLKFKPFRVSRLQRFKDPDHDHIHAAPDRDINTLLIRIKAYREANELEPIEELKTVVEHWQCSQPYNAGACEVHKTLSRSLMLYLKGGIALLKNYAYNKFASQEEADRRADICVKCPKNQRIDLKIYDEWADKVAVASVGDRKSAHHSELYNCTVCSCPMRSKVWYDGKLEFTENEVRKFPVFCWQKKLYIEQNKNNPQEDSEANS